MKIAVSYLKSIYDKKTTIEKINQSNADYLHVDLIDGIFCGEKNYDIVKIIEDLKTNKLPLDIHLMIKNPEEEIEKLALLKPDTITIPVEILKGKNYINKIKEKQIKVGLSINPETSLKELKPYEDIVDSILIMSVHPGKGGQEFLKEVLPKIIEARTQNPKIKISVDGGINDETVKWVRPYVNQVVSGSFVCQKENFNEQIEKLK